MDKQFFVAQFLCNNLPKNPTDEDFKKQEFLAELLSRLEVKENANINASVRKSNEQYSTSNSRS